MASTDHTAHARPSVRNEPNHPPDPLIDRQPHPLGLGLDKLESYGSKLAGIALAVCTLRGLLERSDAFKQHTVPLRRGKPLSWPLNPVQTTGVSAAIYFLQQYADTLSSEPGE